LATNGGSAAVIRPAWAAVTRRRLGAKIIPIASAPAPAAARAAASSMIPQIFTLTTDARYPRTGVSTA
jgi:hypothetical protein